MSRIRRDGRRKTYEGWLVGETRVGQRLIVFCDETARRLLTTPVTRILAGHRGVLYAETLHSVYRVQPLPAGPCTCGEEGDIFRP